MKGVSSKQPPTSKGSKLPLRLERVEVRFLFLVLVFVLVACSNDDDKGDPVPNLYTELCDLYVNSSRVVSVATLDDGTKLDFTSQNIKANVADTTLRSVIMYTPAGGKPRMYSFTPAVCGQALPPTSFPSQPHDPVKLVSIWRSSRYINMSLGEKTTEKGTHRYGFCITGLVSKTLQVSLLHQQPSGDLPSYTNKRYVSLLLHTDHATGYDYIAVTIPTFDGNRTYTFKAE